MAEFIRAEDISEAWVGAMEHLLQVGGSASNLVVEIQTNREHKNVRDVLDRFLISKNDDRIAPVSCVADTIFPVDLYVNYPGEQAREHLYKMERLAARIEKRFVGGSYFDRLIDWPYRLDGETKDKTWNQLEYRLKKLRNVVQVERKQTMNITELGISSGIADEDEDLVLSGDMRTQHPFRDIGRIGFPCLSHISLTLFKGQLDLTATYRNQHFVSKAYGNYVGLMNLLHFFCIEVGCRAGSVVCIATHADGERGKNGFKVQEVIDLVNKSRMLLEGKSS